MTPTLLPMPPPAETPPLAATNAANAVRVRAFAADSAEFAKTRADAVKWEHKKLHLCSKYAKTSFASRVCVCVGVAEQQRIGDGEESGREKRRKG